jgi:Uma2 family endonuclease
MSNLAYSEHYTKEEYYHWEGDWELIYGTPYAMAPSPMVKHQYINMKIARQLDEVLDHCTLCSALFETDVEFGEDTVVRPDSMVLCFKPNERVTKAPTVIFEVISKTTAKRDEQLKFQLYQEEGVKYYIVVYPDVKKAKVYQLVEGTYTKVGDFTNEHYTFILKECSIEFDFSFIWKF